VRTATILLLAAAALLAPAATGAQGTLSAKLQVLRERPALVRGEGFQPGERVTVVLVADERSMRSANANDRGVVTIRFAVALPHCARYSLQAFGSRGSRARSVARRTVCTNPTG
jgi:hypothetical protein